MNVASALGSSRADSPRWLLFGSLALNLFFVGFAVAMYVRQSPVVNRSISTRIERLAATLPGPDAEILRRNYQANRVAVDDTRATYDTSRNAVQAALRHEPFDAAAMRAAMAQASAARQNFNQLLQDIVVAASSEMSQSGRNRLADYPPGSQQGNAK